MFNRKIYDFNFILKIFLVGKNTILRYSIVKKKNSTNMEKKRLGFSLSVMPLLMGENITNSPTLFLHFISVMRLPITVC